MSEPNFEFYVVNYDFNTGKCEMYNIFRNIHVYESSLKEVKKHLRNKTKYPYIRFCEEIRKIIMWQEWGRIQYEISVGKPFAESINDLRKIDCYFQAQPNIEVICDMLIKRYKNWAKTCKECEKDEID